MYCDAFVGLRTIEPIPTGAQAAPLNRFAAITSTGAVQMVRATAVPRELLDQLAAWEDDGSSTFPYSSVVSCFHRHGKHFVPEPLLRALASVRSGLSPGAEGRRHRAPLDDFLAMSLDKWDGRHSYTSYLGIDLIGLTADADAATGRRERRQWVALLLADLRAFEVGDHDWLPEQRPDGSLLRKRLALLDTALAAALPMGAPDGAGGVAEAAEELLAAAPEYLTLALALCMQPVYVVHDEYLFIRVLQAFEVTFAAMAAEIRDAVAAVRCGDAETAASHVDRCTETLSAARILFSVLATMQPGSFQTFRTYTVGASAIQSESYKTFEALCSVPDRNRLESPAYDDVPRVRDRILKEWDDLSSAIDESLSTQTLPESGAARVRSAAQGLENVHQLWKQTHWKMGVRMIGEERGTGYTQGVPYLRDALSNRLFGQLLTSDSGALRA